MMLLKGRSACTAMQLWRVAEATIGSRTGDGLRGRSGRRRGKIWLVCKENDEKGEQW